MDDLSVPPCRDCGGIKFLLADAHVAGQPASIRLTFWKGVVIKCQVCLTCGSVSPKVDRTSLETIRTALAKPDANGGGR